MPTKPAIKTMNANSAEILNAVRSAASPQYQAMVPLADETADSIREIGKIMMMYQPLQNEFLTNLVNRIGYVLVTSKFYNNPWAVFKRGFMEFGETIEEIFVNIAKPFEYDPAMAESSQFKREFPDVLAAFHTINYKKYYKQSIQNETLKNAFLSWDGVTDLIARIVNSMYTGANYDEFLVMKYLIARSILDGNMVAQSVGTVNTANMKGIVADIRGVSNMLEFMSGDYNYAGVQTFTLKDDQYIVVNAQFDAVMDVEVLAGAFNMDKAQFMGRRMLVDSFGALDITRLNQLLGKQPGYVEPSASELASLDAIPAVLLDRDWFMVFDNLQKFTEKYNGEGLYWNYWLHVWKTISCSPFSNAIVFTTGDPTITSVTVTPAAATVSAGQSVQLAANVVTTNFASRKVNWSSDSEAATVDATGLVTVASGTTAATKITITATSVLDPTKTGTAEITTA